MRESPTLITTLSCNVMPIPHDWWCDLLHNGNAGCAAEPATSPTRKNFTTCSQEFAPTVVSYHKRWCKRVASCLECGLLQPHGNNEWCNLTATIEWYNLTATIECCATLDLAKYGNVCIAQCHSKFQNLWTINSRNVLTNPL